MISMPPNFTRTDTLLPYTTRVLSHGHDDERVIIVEGADAQKSHQRRRQPAQNEDDPAIPKTGPLPAKGRSGRNREHSAQRQADAHRLAAKTVERARPVDRSAHPDGTDIWDDQVVQTKIGSAAG